MMTKEELLQILDIEHGREFTYYENLAELLECEKEIGADAIYEVLSEAELSVFAEIVESYFYDIMERMPDDDVDIYNIFEAVKRNLVALAELSTGKEMGLVQDENGNSLIKLAEELDDFHRYYALTENCIVTDREKGISENKSLRDVISDHRLALLDNRELEFDLDGAKDYEIDEFIIGINDLVDEDDAIYS